MIFMGVVVALNLESPEGILLLVVLREMVLKEGLFRKDTFLKHLLKMDGGGKKCVFAK